VTLKVLDLSNLLLAQKTAQTSVFGSSYPEIAVWHDVVIRAEWNNR
jgi:hypothetical protein